MAMTEEAAIARLSDRVAASTFPTLDQPTLERLVRDHVRVDEEGRASDDPEWTGAYDLNRAAAEGWRVKAGKVSDKHGFGSNQGNYNPEQLFEHAMKMADYYAAKGVATIQLASGRWDGRGRLNAAHFEDAV